jgi:hypothetical protein
MPNDTCVLEPVPGLGERELGDDQKRRQPVKGDRDIVVIGLVVPRRDPRRDIESIPVGHSSSVTLNKLQSR